MGYLIAMHCNSLSLQIANQIVEIRVGPVAISLPTSLKLPLTQSSFVFYSVGSSIYFAKKGHLKASPMDTWVATFLHLHI